MERSRLAQLRAQKQWTLEEASERIGVSVNTLSRWEHGIQSPHGYNLQRLCDAYGILSQKPQAVQCFLKRLPGW